MANINPKHATTEPIKAFIVIHGDRKLSFGLDRRDPKVIARYGLIDGRIHVVDTDHGSGRKETWWLVYVENCNEPNKYLIQAENIEEAMEIFYDEYPAEIKIEDNELGDYVKDGYTLAQAQAQTDGELFKDHLHWNGSGTPVDTESVKCDPVEEVWLILETTDRGN